MFPLQSSLQPQLVPPFARIDAPRVGRGIPMLRRVLRGSSVMLTGMVALLFVTTVGATTLPDVAFTAVGCDVGNYSCYSTKVKSVPYSVTPYTYAPAVVPNSATPTEARAPVMGYQYTDNRFCGDGQVTANAQGYFCTRTGVPAWRSDGATSG